MTPLQQAVQAVIEDHCDKSPYFDDAMAELRKALAADLAQEVRPFGWIMASAMDDFKHGQIVEVSRNKEAFDDTPLYTHPATTPAEAQQVAVPPAIEEIKRYSPDMQYDWVRMEPDQHGDWVRYSDFLETKAQQIAVPAKSEPLSPSELHLVYCNDSSAGDWHRAKENYVAGFTAAERHHGITGAKPSHTDWSAA